MNIWTCKRVFAAGALFGALSALSACTDAAGGLFSTGGKAAPRPNTALAQADMARGALRLVPPDGFCVDRRGLRQDFAVLARCDVLGAKTGANGAPLGFIAVSVADTEARGAPVEASALAGSDAVIQSAMTSGPASFVHLNGPTPSGTDAQHWKGVMPAGAYVVSFAAFAPPGGRLSGAEGGVLLSQLAQRVQVLETDSPAVTVGLVETSAPGPFARLRGLLD